MMSQAEAEAVVKDAMKVFESAFELVDEETGFKSIIIKEQFNLLKKK